MAKYDYECRATGETRVLEASMAEAPTIEFEEGGKTWHRVWRSVGTSVKMEGVVYRGHGVPVSRSLPRDRTGLEVTRYGQRVLERPDGTCSTLDGSRIVDSNQAMDRQCKSSGYTHEP